ncbi:hypothetical protein LTR10_000892 [Elasticomyces elasticus]|nr:hypothetical protein LTR10_000892 [Elasticomyces elasticus]KAK4979861.1 hypothetical protein LTR42_000168 [Elasticomyces elasticus]
MRTWGRRIASAFRGSQHGLDDEMTPEMRRSAKKLAKNMRHKINKQAAKTVASQAVAMPNAPPALMRGPTGDTGIGVASPTNGSAGGLPQRQQVAATDQGALTTATESEEARGSTLEIMSPEDSANGSQAQDQGTTGESSGPELARMLGSAESHQTETTSPVDPAEDSRGLTTMILGQKNDTATPTASANESDTIDVVQSAASIGGLNAQLTATTDEPDTASGHTEIERSQSEDIEFIDHAVRVRRVGLKVGKTLARIHDALRQQEKSGKGVLTKQMRDKMTNIAVVLAKMAKNKHGEVEPRRIIWRTVLRSNYFWPHPDTQEPTILKVPLQPPRTILDQVERYVYWRAQQEEQMGRTIPLPAHVYRVRSDLNLFLQRAQDASEHMELAHLAFLCKFDEVQHGQSPSGITIGDMRERVRLAFPRIPVAGWASSSTFRPLEADDLHVSRMEAELVELEKIWSAVQDNIARVSVETQRPVDASTSAEVLGPQVTDAIRSDA